MEYILSTKEYDALTPVKGLQDRNEALEIARQIIKGNSSIRCNEGYCDMCPISDIGGEPTENRPTREISRMICQLPRNYSK